jgi:hypothetical protein
VLSSNKLYKVKNLVIGFYEVFSIQGKKILQNVLTEKRSKLNISQFPKGTYFVRLTQNKKVFSQQIVIGK